MRFQVKGFGVRVSGGHLCEAEAPTEATAETSQQVFLHLSAHGFSLKMRECDYKGYACCQRSGRKHSLQKNGLCLYTGDACSPLSLKKRMRYFFKKVSQSAHTTAVVYKCAIVPIEDKFTQ